MLTLQFMEVARLALPQFVRAVHDGLAQLAMNEPSHGEVRLKAIQLILDESSGQDQYACVAEATGEAPLHSFVYLPHLDEPERLYEHFLSDAKDWIVESGFGWGANLP